MKDYRKKAKVIRNPTVEYVDIHIIIDDEQLFLNEIKGSWAGRVYQSSCVLFEVLADEDDHITFRSVHLNPEFGNKLLLTSELHTSFRTWLPDSTMNAQRSMLGFRVLFPIKGNFTVMNQQHIPPGLMSSPTGFN